MEISVWKGKVTGRSAWSLAPAVQRTNWVSLAKSQLIKAYVSKCELRSWVRWSPKGCHWEGHTQAPLGSSLSWDTPLRKFKMSQDTHSCPKPKASFQHSLCLLCSDVFWHSTFTAHVPWILLPFPLLHLPLNLIDAWAPGMTSMTKTQIQLRCIAGSQGPIKQSPIIPFPWGEHSGFCALHSTGSSAIHVRSGSDYSFQISEQHFWSLLPSQISSSEHFFMIQTLSPFYM